MKKIMYLLAGLSLMFFIGCNDSYETIEIHSENLAAVKNIDFKKKSPNERGEFLVKCLKDPLGMGMIKFDRNKVKEYNIKNRDLEGLLMHESETKEVFFYGEFFTIKSKIKSKTNFAKNSDFHYYGDSQLSICSGIIFANMSNGLVNDNCDQGKMGFNVSAMNSYSGTNAHGTIGGPYYMEGCSWDTDCCGDSQTAVNVAPVGEVFVINN